MNATPPQKSRFQKPFLWPVAGIFLGAIVSTNPFYQPHLSLEVVTAAWIADMGLVLLPSIQRVAERVGILVAGLFFAIPCFLDASPLSRALLMCGMALPFAIATLSLFAPPSAGFPARLAYFFTWMGTQKITRRPASFDIAALVRLLIATMVFAGAVACVNDVSDVGFELLVRWFAGGIMMLAFAEMITAGHDLLTAGMGLIAPAVMRSPFLSTSIGEFWSKRWNLAASALLFRPLFFPALARRGIGLALFVPFLASAIAHTLLAFMAAGRWEISLICGAFFLAQPLLILLERKINVRRWPSAAARVWTLAALLITSPLFVEPAVQIMTPDLDATNSVLPPIIAALGIVIFVNLLFSVGALVSCPKSTPLSAVCATSRAV